MPRGAAGAPAPSSRPERPAPQRSRRRSTSPRPRRGRPAGNGQEFLDAAVAHANERLTGTLGANVLIEPATQEALGGGFDRAIADLHYGTVAINAWTAFGFLTPTATWGAYPGGTIEDAPSGMGVVHNAFLLDSVERTVVRGPFRPFPGRSPRCSARDACRRARCFRSRRGS